MSTHQVPRLTITNPPAAPRNLDACSASAAGRASARGRGEHGAGGGREGLAGLARAGEVAGPGRQGDGAADGARLVDERVAVGEVAADEAVPAVAAGERSTEVDVIARP